MRAPIVLALAASLVASQAAADEPCAAGDVVCDEVALARELRSEASGEERAELEAKLAAVRKRRAQLDVVAGYDELEVRIDGACPTEVDAIAPRCAPLDRAASLIVNPGLHDVRFRQPGYETRFQRMDLGPGAVVRIRVSFAVATAPPRNPYVVPTAIAWAATAGFALAAGLTTLDLAISNDGDTSRRDTLKGARVVALLGAGLGLAVSTYLTVLAVRWTPPRSPALDVGLAPAGLVVRGAF